MTIGLSKSRFHKGLVDIGILVIKYQDRPEPGFIVVAAAAVVVLFLGFLFVVVVKGGAFEIAHRVPETPSQCLVGQECFIAPVQFAVVGSVPAQLHAWTTLIP